MTEDQGQADLTIATEARKPWVTPAITAASLELTENGVNVQPDGTFSS